jgi:hypothetical protein
MDLKKFKKFTNNETKIRKIVPYSFIQAFDNLLVTRVINYYTIEAIIFNNNEFNKWRFILNEVNTLDNKLSIDNREYLRKKLEEICLNKYFRFNIIKAKLQDVLGSIIFDDKDMQLNSTVNTMMVNMTINLIILKDKIYKNEKRKGSGVIGNSPLKKSVTANHTKLTTIIEDKEVTEFDI